MSKEKESKPKEPSIKDLKAMAFDLDMKMKQLQQQYNTILQKIAEKIQK